MSRPWRGPPQPPQLSLVDAALRALAPWLSTVPASLVTTALGPPPEDDRSRSLDPATHLLLALQGSTAGPDTTVAQKRHDMRRGIALIDGPRVPVHSLVETVLADDLPARVYRPSAETDLPWLMFIHGGGWVVGDLDSHDRFCRRLCAEAGLVVVAVDYRLAPESPFPAGLRDIERAWAAVQEAIVRFGGAPGRGGVAGDSAGGNLAAVLCQRTRDGRAPGPVPRCQVLVYPVMDFRRLDRSHRTFADGFLLTAASIDLYKARYAAPDDADPQVSPLLHPDLSRLPPALVVTAGFDPLRDEGERTVHALREAGTPVGWREGAGLVHGFVQMDSVLPAAEQTVAALIAATSTLAHTGTVPPDWQAATPPGSSAPRTEPA